jgi:hypothetical protein
MTFTSPGAPSGGDATTHLLTLAAGLTYSIFFRYNLIMCPCLTRGNVTVGP